LQAGLLVVAAALDHPDAGFKDPQLHRVPFNELNCMRKHLDIVLGDKLFKRPACVSIRGAPQPR